MAVQHYENRVLTYLCFALLGCVNTLLPFIVHSANYLIIPYPRWVVLLIEATPALAVKLLLPHVLPRIAHGTRPLLFGCCWALMAIVTKATPPNVPPPVRVFTSILASTMAAATEVSVLGTLRHHGRAGLAGWGAGTGLGAMACAVMPFGLTVWLSKVVRSSIICIYALAATMLFAYLAIIPPRQLDMRPGQHGDDVESARGLSKLLAKVTPLTRTKVLGFKEGVDLAGALLRPFMLPLFLAFAAQSFIFPGISRALPVLESFQTFFGFSTAYGLSFHFGSFISRTFILLFRPRNTRVPLFALGLTTAIAILSTTLLPIASFFFLGLVAFCAGLMGGAVYITIFSEILDEPNSDSATTEFEVQVIGAGETAGSICGGLFGQLALGILCQTNIARGQRWCQISR